MSPPQLFCMFLLQPTSWRDSFVGLFSFCMNPFPLLQVYVPIMVLILKRTTIKCYGIHRIYLIISRNSMYPTTFNCCSFYFKIDTFLCFLRPSFTSSISSFLCLYYFSLNNRRKRSYIRPYEPDTHILPL